MGAKLLAAILVVAAAISGGAQAQMEMAKEIAPTGMLRVAMIGANPVLVTRSSGGTPTGVSVDLGKLIAEKLGVPFIPVVYETPATYTQSFGKGEWDIAIGPRNSLRAAGYDVSPDFMLVDNQYVAAPGRAFVDANEVDRPGVKVAVALDGAPDKFLSKSLKSAQLVRVSGSVAAGIAVLRDGNADAYGSNGQFVYEIAQGLPGAKILPGAFTTVEMAVGFPQGRSPVAQNVLGGVVSDAKRAGVIQKAIYRNGLRGVRVVPD